MENTSKPFCAFTAQNKMENTFNPQRIYSSRTICGYGHQAQKAHSKIEKEPQNPEG